MPSPSGKLRAVRGPAGGTAIARCEAMQSALAPAGPAAEGFVTLATILAGGAAVILVLVMALLVHGALGEPRRASTGLWVIGGGILFPVAVLSALLGYDQGLTHALTAPAPPATPRIEVEGRQWWWEVRYLAPAAGRDAVVTANEIHIPTGRAGRAHPHDARRHPQLLGAELAGKVDMMPGRRNRLTLHASREGLYRGQCAEYCGVQHAQMALLVVAAPRATFETWLAREAAPASAPATPRWPADTTPSSRTAAAAATPSAARRRWASSDRTSRTSGADGRWRRERSRNHVEATGRLDRLRAAAQARQPDAVLRASGSGHGGCRRRVHGEPRSEPAESAAPPARRAPATRSGVGAAAGLADFLGGQQHATSACSTSRPRSCSSCSAGSPRAAHAHAARGARATSCVGPDTYNQLFTMHGTIMMFLFAVPVVEAIGVYLLPSMRPRATCRSRGCQRLCVLGVCVGGLAFFCTIFFGVAPDGGWFMYPAADELRILARHQRRLLAARHRLHRDLGDRRRHRDHRRRSSGPAPRA